jgi:hypothetical protein
LFGDGPVDDRLDYFLPGLLRKVHAC